MTSAKRGQNEGSIYQRDSDGRWVGGVSLGYGVDGKRVRRVVYGRTRAEVSAKLLKVQQDHAAGLPVKVEKQTVGPFLARWLEEVKPTVRPKTYASYAQIVRLHLSPALGRHPLAKLTPDHVAKLLRKKSEDGLSPRTVQYVRAVLRQALGLAVDWGLLSRNVATLVKPPRSVHHEMRFLTPTQARALLDAAKGDRLEALYGVALALGLRQGEALGLRWRDVDFEAGTVGVRVALQRVATDAPEDGKPRSALLLTETKTAQSRRTLTMPAGVAAALKAHRDRQRFERDRAGATWVELDFVFCTPKGTPLDARNVVRQFKILLGAADLPNMRWHDLRHSCASLLLAQRVPYRAVMEVMGHSQISLTMRYSHLVPELRQEAADAMERALAAGT